MSNLKQRLALKQNEVALCQEQWNVLWERKNDAQKKYETEYRDPWFNCNQKLNELKKELEVLEGIAKEVEAA